MKQYKYYLYLSIGILSVIVCLLFTTCRTLSATAHKRDIKSEKNPTEQLHAQMFVKGGADEEGFIPCHAEGKYYGIKAVDSISFGPEEDSFHKMHHHGVAIESKLMAYRIYFDKRQTIDVYAKRTPQLELAQSLWYPNDSLLSSGYGDDVLKVGNSIGLGSVRPYLYKDSTLFKMDRFEQRTQRILYVTADSAAIEVEVRGMQIGDTIADLRTRYTMLSGHRDMRCEVFCSAPLHSLVTGVQKVGKGMTMEMTIPESTTLLSWGTDWPVNDTVKYAKETIGLAVQVPSLYAGKSFRDSKQRLCPLRLQTTKNQDYYCKFYLTAVSLKEQLPPATTKSEFIHYIRLWSPVF